MVLEMSRPEPNIQIAISIVENSPDSDVNDRGRCARAASGHAAAPLSRPMNWRRLLDHLVGAGEQDG